MSKYTCMKIFSNLFFGCCEDIIINRILKVILISSSIVDFILTTLNFLSFYFDGPLVPSFEPF